MKQETKIKLLLLIVILVAVPFTVNMAGHIQQIFKSFAAGSANLSITPSSQTIGIGQTGTVNVHINPNAHLVNAVEVVITYNASVIDVTNVAPGPFFTDKASQVGTPVEVYKSIGSGRIHYAVGFPLGSQFGSSESKVAVIINVKGKTSGTTNLSFVSSGTIKVNISDINAVNVYNSGANGSVTVSSTSITPTPTSSTAKPGDANGDGKVDGFDYVVWWQNFNKNVTGGATQGDFDNSGYVDGFDYVVWWQNFGT